MARASLCLLSGYFVFVLTAFAQIPPALRYNHEYICNKERVVISHCRKDSDQPGFAPTKPEDDYCQIYYPDRPKTGGFQASAIVLRGDVNKTLSACGALQSQAASTGNPKQPGENGTGNPASPATGSQASTVDPAAVAHFERGKEFYKAEDYTKAIAEFEQAVALKLDADRLGSTYALLGDSYFTTRQYPKAIEFISKVLVIEKNADFYKMLGDAYERTLQFAKALPAFKEAVRLDPKHAGHLYALGSDYILNGQPDEARKVYDAMVTLKAENAKYLLGELENKQGKIAIFIERGEIGLLGQDHEEAQEWFHNALRLNPTSVSALLDIGRGLGGSGKYEEAIAVFRRIIAMKPDVEDAASAHYYIGENYNELKDYAKALPELIEANRLKPDYYTKNEIGTTYFQTKQFQKALASFQDASKLKPKEAEAHVMIGQTYAAMGQIDDAVAALQELVAVDPKSSRGWCEIGKIYFEAKRYPDAGRSYTSALAIDPKDTLALFGIGKTYAAVGRKAEAMRAYTSLKPIDEKLAQELLNEINKR